MQKSTIEEEKEKLAIALYKSGVTTNAAIDILELATSIAQDSVQEERERIKQQLISYPRVLSYSEETLLREIIQILTPTPLENK